jgi:hypothetical protein
VPERIQCAAVEKVDGRLKEADGEVFCFQGCYKRSWLFVLWLAEAVEDEVNFFFEDTVKESSSIFPR